MDLRLESNQVQDPKQIPKMKVFVGDKKISFDQQSASTLKQVSPKAMKAETPSKRARNLYKINPSQIKIKQPLKKQLTKPCSPTVAWKQLENNRTPEVDPRG